MRFLGLRWEVVCWCWLWMADAVIIVESSEVSNGNQVKDYVCVCVFRDEVSWYLNYIYCVGFSLSHAVILFVLFLWTSCFLQFISNLTTLFRCGSKSSPSHQNSFHIRSNVQENLGSMVDLHWLQYDISLSHRIMIYFPTFWLFLMISM